METASELSAEHILLAGAIILGVGSMLGFVARRLRVPDIVLFLLAGILLGPSVPWGVLDIPATSTLSWVILIFGASYILFDGGATLRLEVLSRVWISLSVIVTIGVIFTAIVTGLAAQWVLGVPVMVGLLLGSAVAATDPATLVPVFKQVHIREKVSQFVVSESAFNDPTGAILTITLLAAVMGGGGSHFPIGRDALQLLLQAGIGIGAGVILGYAASVFVAHERWGFLLEYLPAITLIVVIGGYLGAAGLNASGFMAAFIAGLVMGNMHYFGLRMTPADRGRFNDFVETTALMARMFIFLLLGSQVKLELVAQYWWQGLVVVAVLMFIARPATVLLCALPDRRARWTWRELVFVSWTRETGVIPGALASILVGERAPHADVLAAIIFVTILVTIIVQATTAKWVAGRLGLLVHRGHPAAKHQTDGA